MAYYKTGYRKIDGHRRKVRKLVVGGKIVSVRIANRPHYTDKTAKKYGLHRVKGHVNNPNRARRRDSSARYGRFGYNPKLGKFFQY